MKHPTNPIRVCFVSPKAYTLFNPNAKGTIGGAEVDLYYLATELAKDNNFAVSFIVADYGQASTEQHENVNVIKSLNFNHSPLRSALRLAKAFDNANANIYFIKTASPGVPLLAWFCRKHQRALVYRTAHQYECDGTYRRQHPLVGRAFDWAIRHAQLLTTQNDVDAQILKNRTGLDSRVIPNGHRLPNLTQYPRKTVLWVGRSADFKQPNLFVDLARQRPNRHFTMICQRATDDRQYDQLVEQATQTPNLTFIPRVPFHEIESHFLWAQLHVSTSRAEGFPNTFIQACKCATPILSLNVNPDAFLDTHQCGLCAQGDWQRFLTMLDQLADPETAHRYGQNGRRYARQKHDLATITDKYKQEFRRILNS